MSLIDQLRDRIRFDRNELAGSFGDVGTDLPLILAMIPAAGLDAPGVFVMFGLMQILTGAAYGLPMPMQPLKAMAVIVIAERISGSVLLGGGLAIGIAMFGLSISGALAWLARVIPLCVVRGIQFGLGLSLASLAVRQYLPDGGAAGWALAALSFALILVLSGNRLLPAALPVIALGTVYAFFSGAPSAGLAGVGISFQLPAVALPQWQDIATGFVVLALPQLPLSLSNSVIATERTVRDLFPERPVSVRKIGITYALANLVNPFFGGIPVCHGAGGLAGHHAFGARTGGSVIIYGSLFVLFGLFFGGAALALVSAFPKPVLGTILLFEAVALLLFIRHVADSRRDLLIALLVALSAWTLPQGYLIGVVLGSVLYYSADRLAYFRE